MEYLRLLHEQHGCVGYNEVLFQQFKNCVESVLVAAVPIQWDPRFDEYLLRLRDEFHGLARYMRIPRDKLYNEIILILEGKDD